MAVDLSSFRIIRPPTHNISLSELRISPTKFILSPIAVAELDYPEFIAFFYSEESQQLLIAPSIENEFTVPFLPKDGLSTPLKAISVGHTALAKALRNNMKWGSKGTYRIKGVKVPEASCLLFDLKTAASGKREAVQFDPVKFLESCPKAEDLMLSPKFTPLYALPPASS